MYILSIMQVAVPINVKLYKLLAWFKHLEKSLCSENRYSGYRHFDVNLI